MVRLIYLIVADIAGYNVGVYIMNNVFATIIAGNYNILVAKDNVAIFLRNV